MLKINGLKKSYKGFSVLRGLNMSINKGDIYGFLGTNGCGKTTTMNIICNIIPKDGGAIDFEEEGLKIGYLPESPSLFGYMNGFEYLNFIGACCDYEGNIKERTAEVLQLTGMFFHAQRYLKGYSRGMIQRIGIAAALYAHPDLLILDDWGPDRLNASQRRDLMEIIEDRHGRGSILITSQLKVEKWHEVIAEPTFADAILDRIVHNAYRLNLDGPSIRKIKAANAQAAVPDTATTAKQAKGVRQ